MEESHDVLHNSFPDLSLESGSLSNILYDTCLQCGKLFANELDVKNHIERVHEYGELFQLYPCEECGMRASDLNEIRQHIKEEHCGEISLESMGIEQLPTVTKRRKQHFSGLVIDEFGTIDADELDTDEDFDEHLLQDDTEDDDDETVSEEVEESKRRTTRKRKPIQHVVSPPKKKKKVETKRPEKLKKQNNSALSCDICESTFSRKDNLLRHIKNKH